MIQKYELGIRIRILITQDMRDFDGASDKAYQQALEIYDDTEESVCSLGTMEVEFKMYRQSAMPDKTYHNYLFMAWIASWHN